MCFDSDLLSVASWSVVNLNDTRHGSLEMISVASRLLVYT